MRPGVFQILIIALIILVLFGRGRISELMGDFGKGVKSFRKGLADDDRPPLPSAVDGPGRDARAASAPAGEQGPAPDPTFK